MLSDWALDHCVVPDPPLSSDAVHLANDLALVGVGIVEDRIVAGTCLPELGELIEAGVLVHRHGARAGMLALCEASDEGVASE